MRPDSNSVSRLLTHHGCVVPLLFLMALLPLSGSALTVRAKSDMRLWETVTDRSGPLAWAWAAKADAATLTFSNRLTRAVSSTNVMRTAEALRGSCAHPVPADEALVVATLVQTAGGVEIARETAELAYVPGVATTPSSSQVAAQPITVRTKACSGWWRVRLPRLSAFDARWWNAVGPSGYEVLWQEPAGPHRVVRAFEGAGVVDETVLKFGTSGILVVVR